MKRCSHTTLEDMDGLQGRRLPHDQLRRFRHAISAIAAIPQGYGKALEDFDALLPAAIRNNCARAIS